MKFSYGLLLCAAAFAANLTSGQKELNLSSFDQVWTTIRDRHYDPKMNGVDWGAVRAELRPEMEHADTMQQARGVLGRMIDRLGLSHYGIIPTGFYSENGDLAGGSGITGIECTQLGEYVLVTRVEPGSPAAQAGVRQGWRIRKANETDVEELARRMRSVKAPHRDLAVAQALRGRLSGWAGEALKIEFANGADEPIVRNIVLVEGKGNAVKFGHLPPARVWFESKKLPGEAGYVRFNMFLDPAMISSGFADAVQSCMKCRGFIIDLRGNPGGIGIMAMGMAGWFVDNPNQKLGTMISRETSLNFVISSRAETFNGPVAVLVDGATASTSEIFAGGLQDLKRARIFGARTAGAALPSLIVRLPNGDGFQYAQANYISEGGKPLEGIGVTPDVEVSHTREALLRSKDAVVEAALEWIAKQ